MLHLPSPISFDVFRAYFSTGATGKQARETFIFLDVKVWRALFTAMCALCKIIQFAKVYVLSRKQGVERSFLRTASQQCLSAMTWYMKDHWYILSNSDEVTTILQFMAVSLLVNTYEESIGRRTWRW